MTLQLFDTQWRTAREGGNTEFQCSSAELYQAEVMLDAVRVLYSDIMSAFQYDPAHRFSPEGQLDLRQFPDTIDRPSIAAWCKALKVPIRE
jgi:hypothetical protein